MKTACMILFAALFLIAGSAAAQQRWIAVGPQINGLSGSGEGENKFDGASKNIGVVVEFGVQMPGAKLAMAFQAEWYKSNNWVGGHSVPVNFLVPFGFEARYFLKKSGSIIPYIGGGTVWSRMGFSGSKGADNQFLLQATAGVQMRVAKGKFLIQPCIKPYVVMSNSLEQKSGLQASILVGSMW